MTPDPSDDTKDQEPPWHERTSSVVGASVGALAVIGLLWLVISYVAGGSDDPEPASQYYLDPTVSGSNSFPSTTTSGASTETITSTSPPVTTDINPGETSTTTGTDTSTTSTTPFDPSNLPRTRTSTSSDGGATSTRRRPRLNETRTLYPQP
ncbi:cell division protein CrgA [Mycolicibacterium hodleri]|uniref:Uncharacterized protein n=1 Tax=Mycolicibacterium hodleri TaxID=49897 RepID=A0A502DZ05_9MYCO|nr:cell division protein CrgA [Mycolicibacterium hodleri]TPG29899.1 hypothetical protein EAH80_25170 [Mycolicibacterium hodleri]